MKRLLYILLLFPLLVSGQVVVNLSPDSTLYDLHKLPGGTVIDTTVFYVDAISGDDTKHGNSPDSSWQTITRVIAGSYDPGDSILFNKGDTWRLVDDGDAWEIDWIGTDGNPIAISTYGAGDKPRVLGSDTITDWVDLTANLWVGVKAAIDSFPTGRIYFEELTTGDTVTWGILETTSAGVDATNEYYFANDSVYIYSTSDPSTAFFSVEISQVDNLISMQTGGDSTEYITFDGLELAYAYHAGIQNEYPGGITGQTRALSGIEVRNSHIHHIGEKNSAGAFGLELLYSDMIIEDNEINDIGRRGISIVSDNSFTSTTLGNNIIRNNHLHDGYHTTGIDINNVTNACTYNGFEIYGNTIEDDSSASITDPDAVGNVSISHGMFLASQGTNTNEDYDIYNNIGRHPKGRFIQTDDVDTVRMHHNTVYGGNDNMSLDYSHFAFGGTQDSLLFQNNVSYITITGYRSIQQGNPTTTTMDYNLYHSDFPSVNQFWHNGVGYAIDDWAAYLAATGWEANSPNPADPIFNNAPDSLFLRGDSPGVGAGVALASYTVDKNGVAVSSPPNIGAYEDTILRLPPVPLVVTDDFAVQFNPLDDDPDWEVAIGSMKTLGGNVYSQVGSDSAMAYWNDTFTDDQYAYVILSATIAGAHYVGAAVRSSSGNGYAISADVDDWVLNKLVAGVWTDITGGALTLDAGDTLKIEVSGTTITCYENSNQLTQQTDSDLSSGAPGVQGYNNGSTRATAFEGGDGELSVNLVALIFFTIINMSRRNRKRLK